MKIFLDDDLEALNRQTPVGWQRVRSAWEAIYFLEREKVEITWFVLAIMYSAPNALEGDALFGYQKIERLWEYNVLQVTV